MTGGLVSYKILIVDDDDDALELIAMIMRRQGYETVVAHSGYEALGLLAHDVPDLIILDVMMPGMDGNEVCQHIRADSRTAHIPIVMLTARSATANQIEGLLAGADDYLVKPSSSSELIKSVETALARALAGPEQRAAIIVSVLGARGGVGASTLAVNLAAALAAQRRTILLDLEPNGTAALHLGLAPQHGLRDLAAYPMDQLDLPAIEAALTPALNNLNVLASAPASIDTAHAGALLNQLRAAYDVCLCDLGAGLSPLAMAIAPRSHTLVLAIDADRVTLAQAQQVISGAKEAESPWPEIRLVRVNRLGAPDDAARAAVRAVFGKDAIVIHQAADAMYQALEHGQPLVTHQPDHPVAAQLRALADLLLTEA
jgi:DNA-binding response OmpR family regulator